MYGLINHDKVVRGMQDAFMTKNYCNILVFFCACGVQVFFSSCDGSLRFFTQLVCRLLTEGKTFLCTEHNGKMLNSEKTAATTYPVTWAVWKKKFIRGYFRDGTPLVNDKGDIGTFCVWCNWVKFAPLCVYVCAYVSLFVIFDCAHTLSLSVNQSVKKSVSLPINLSVSVVKSKNSVVKDKGIEIICLERVVA